jgi:hypothetical protein
MEIHQHSHSERKKWSHYLWEFFMLFMAVTLGFFVENQREHYVEHRRGSQYINSFIEDVEQDTAYFADYINDYSEKTNVLDNMFDCYDSVTGKIRSNNCLISIIEQTGGFPDFIYTDRTLQQLKNSGGLRLLDPADADSITIYDNTLRSMEKNETTEIQETQTLLRNITYELINFSITMKVRDNDHETDTAKLNKAALLYGSNPGLLNKYFNVLYHYNWLMHGQVYNFQKLLSMATSLISYLKKEHHLK